MKAAAIGFHKNGSRLFLDVSVGEMTFGDGRKYVATLTDVSKLKFAQKVLQETHETLARLNPDGMEESPSLKE